MSRPFMRFFAAAIVAVSGLSLVAVTFDAEAARVGKGGSSGRQSSNVTSQKSAQPAAATSNTTQRTAAPAAATAGTAAAGAAAKTGASRWLGPLAGIAAGLGIAALLSHLGLGGALADFLVLALIAGAVIFGVMFIMRRMRGPQPAAQGAGAGGSNDNAMWRESNEPASQTPQSSQAPLSLPSSATGSMSAAGFGSDAPAPDQNWFIPVDFDTQRFLSEAKKQFVSIQKVWDSGNVSEMRNFLTDDLMKELQAQLSGRIEENHTEAVLLNAELLGIEKVSDGHLASVRFSGMLREQAGTEAFRFEEVWNLFKPEQGGWLLAGIQQIPVSQAS